MISKAFVVTRVEVSIKKMSNRKTISVIEDMLKWGFILLCDFKIIYEFLFSLIKSINSIAVDSISKTTLEIFETR